MQTKQDLCRSDLSRRCDNFLFKFSTMTFSQMQMKFIVEPIRLDHATKHDCFGNCQDVENSVGKQENRIYRRNIVWHHHHVQHNL